jgi:apolipoprotein N-acyltransferase
VIKGSFPLGWVRLQHHIGICCFIDPYGRITSRVAKGNKDIFVEGTLIREILLSPAGTFYRRYGDVLAFGCIAFSAVFMVWVSLKDTCRRRAA